MKSACYKMWLLLACFLISATVWSQVKKVSGVVSGDDGLPLPGVSVMVKGQSNGTQTNADGVYVIDAATGDVLVFTFSGYAPKEVKIGTANTYNVNMLAGDSKMDEVVVVGYGSSKRSKVNSSIAKLDPQVLETGLRSNPAQALAGTIAGLRVSTGSGRPGALPSIVLRGGTGFGGDGSPLVIVDGQLRGSLSDINPEDIESMEVLKDASATAIYGARASNGVILVTTKKGKAGTSAIHLKAQRGYSYLNVPYNFLSAGDYIKWQRLGVVEAIKNGTLGASTLAAVGPRGTGNLYKDVNGNILDGNYDSRAVWSTMRLTDENRELLSQPGWKTMKDAVPTNANGYYDPNGTYADLIYKEFNYRDYAFKSPAVSQDYNIGISGGNDKGRYYSNLGYYNEDGLSLATFYRRLTYTLNGEYKIKDWLKSESGISYAKANWRDQSLQNGESNYWGRMLSAPPTMRGTNANGELLLGRDASDGNPVINVDKYIRDYQTDKFTFNQAFKFDLTKNFYIRLNGILMYDEGHYESFNKDYRTGYLSYTDPNKGWNRDRSSSASFDRTISQTYNAIANYSTRFLDKNSVEAMVGFEYYDRYTKGLDASGKLAPTDDFMDLGLTVGDVNGVGARSINSNHSRERIMSGFGRLNYDYDGKYFATFTVRRDGYSRLLGDNQYGTFPAVSLGWLIHKEDFMASTSNWLSFLKLRAGWGKNGNVGVIGTYDLQGSYGPQSAYNGTIGFLMTGLENPNLRWESTNTVEGALDMGFLQNRINATVAVYNRVTNDKLASVILPASTGVGGITTNNGSMRNRGVELEASYKVIQKKEFNWKLTANAAWNKNTVLKLPYNGNESNRQGGTQVYDPATGQLIWVEGLQEGQEWGAVYGYKTDGIIRNEKDLEDYNKIDLAAGQVQWGGAAGKKVASQQLITERGLSGFISTKLGDMKWKDIDQNDTIDYRDRVLLGRQLPRWTGGFNTLLTWKGFSVFARVDFALGHVQQDFMQMWSLGSMQGEFNATDVVLDTWTPENPNAKFPRYTWADQLNTKNFDRTSDMFFVKSDYLAFREVSLSYSLPASLLDRTKISGLTFTVTGQNLGYLTNSQLKLPERTGSQNSAYTIPTQLIFGAKLTF
jgi:TonB-linked SusC/RagA family outer membrane protein